MSVWVPGAPNAGFAPAPLHTVQGHVVNSLAVRPGRILISEGAPRAVERLQQAGVETIEVPYSEIRKNGGEIHCSTLPLLRDED